jgi:hypothetical protein
VQRALGHKKGDFRVKIKCVVPPRFIEMISWVHLSKITDKDWWFGFLPFHDQIYRPRMEVDHKFWSK